MSRRRMGWMIELALKQSKALFGGVDNETHLVPVDVIHAFIG